MPGETFSDIAPLLAREGIALTAAQVRRLERFAALLGHWNQRINLTGERERLFSRHLLDCLMLARLPLPPGATAALDIGSGAGLPGLVVALLHPQCRVTSVDSAAKKISFQQVAAAELGLENFAPLRDDVHRLAAGEGAGRFDLVMARAFASLPVLLGLAEKLLRPGGVLWAMKGRRLAQEQAALTPAVLAPFETEPLTCPYEFPQVDLGGVLAVYRKKGGQTGQALGRRKV